MRQIIITAGLAAVVAASLSAGTAKAADFDYGYAPPPPVARVYERPVIVEERPIVEERRVLVEPRPAYRPYYQPYGYYRSQRWPRYAYGWHPHHPRFYGWDR